MIRKVPENRNRGLPVFSGNAWNPRTLSSSHLALEVKGKGGELTDTCHRLLGNISVPNYWLKIFKKCVVFLYPDDLLYQHALLKDL